MDYRRPPDAVPPGDNQKVTVSADWLTWIVSTSLMVAVGALCVIGAIFGPDSNTVRGRDRPFDDLLK